MKNFQIVAVGRIRTSGLPCPQEHGRSQPVSYRRIKRNPAPSGETSGTTTGFTQPAGMLAGFFFTLPNIPHSSGLFASTLKIFYKNFAIFLSFDNVPNFVKLVTGAYKQIFLLTYKTYHISCDLSNRKARVRSNRLVRA